MDDPVEAAKLVDESLDPPTRKYVPAAARGIDAAPELACQELGDWYYSLAAQAATPTAKAAVLQRAKGYYDRFLALHTVADPARDTAVQALKKVDSDLVALGPAARAARTRRLLIITLAKGNVHKSTPLALKAITEAGQKTHAFDATASEDPTVFNKALLSRFDALCLLNASGDICPDADSRQALLDFVRGGKGLAAIHAATSANANWPAYADMLGAAFAGSPFRRFTVKVDDPSSPINASLGGRGFECNEELYAFKEPYSRNLVHVLLSVDIANSGYAAARLAARGDADYPVSWIRTYGQGRVFCTAIGHDEADYTTPAILNHMLAGIRFALGDLRADTTPGPRLSPRPPRG
jgi:hypothetical protein